MAVSNLVTRDRQFASADWEFHPRWRAGAGGAWSTSENSRLQQRSQDYEDDSEYVYLTYLTPKGSKLRGEFRHLDAKYPYRELVAGSLIDNSYTQIGIQLCGRLDGVGQAAHSPETGIGGSPVSNRDDA